MADPIEPTQQELEQLTSGGPQPEPEMPDPEPEVLERAQQLLDRAADGTEDPQVVEGGGPLPGEAHVRTDPTLTADQKLRFLAHILGDQGYEQRYQFLGGRMCLTFRTVSAAHDQRLASLASSEAQDAAHRRQLYFTYLMVACLTEVEIDQQVQAVEAFQDHHELDLRAYTSFINSLNREQYLLIYQTARRFRQDLDRMLDKVDDPDFWPTLS